MGNEFYVRSQIPQFSPEDKTDLERGAMIGVHTRKRVWANSYTKLVMGLSLCLEVFEEMEWSG